MTCLNIMINDYYLSMIKIISRQYQFSQIATYTRRGKHRPAQAIKPLDVICSFQCKSSKYYKDFDINHLQMEHQTYGTKIHQLQCSQQNNTLSFIFKSPPNAKKGLNLAVQKLLKCGSLKYPVRNLSQQISKRSFSQLIESQSTQDYLMFTFNTPILKDFKNLLNVHSSMLFAPLFRQQDFYDVIRRFTYDQQRLGYTGQLAVELYQNQFNIDQTIYSLINENLLGNTELSTCQSFDLAHIRFEQLRQHYHKTVTLGNCTMILHGDMNLHYFIEEFNKNCEQFKPKIDKTYALAADLGKEFTKKTIDFEHLRQETVLMLSYRMDNITDQQGTLLQILSYLLFDMPESPFMRYLSPETPYPNLYGFRQRYFNIGISFKEPEYIVQDSKHVSQHFKQKQKLFIQKQIQMIQLLKQLHKRKLSDKMIQKCLRHLQNNLYQQKGIFIIESIVDKILRGSTLDSTFEVSSLITNLLKNYRKNNVFQSLLKKFIIDNDNYIVLRGFNNVDLVEEENRINHSLLLQFQSTMNQAQLNEIASYQPPTYLQNVNSLPQIAPNELEFFQDTQGSEEKIKNIKTVYNARHFGNRLVFKFDLTDIGQEDIPILTLFCKSFTEMGYFSIKQEAYHHLIQNFIGKIEMNYETIRSHNGQLKIQCYLAIQFTDRNHEHAFSVLTGLFTSFNYNNLMSLSRVIHKESTSTFHEVSQNILHYHGVHLAASKSPFVFFESPIFKARTLCSIAADMKKVTNPKVYLQALSKKFQQIWEKMMQWSRIQVLWECHPEKRSHYRRYLQILLSQIKNQGIPPETIQVQSFPGQKWLKYFPNYENQLIFEAFKVPLRQKQSPACLVLSSIINSNISNYNEIGGCFLYKGVLISFMQGNRKKYLQLQDHYKRIEKIDQAKRRIFQKFNRFTIQQQFRHDISFKEARFFKEAVIAVSQAQIEQCLHNYILKSIKEDTSSMLALGQRLQNYEPLIKKGWQIERSIEDMSLGMQSLSRQKIQFKMQKYIDIC